MINVDGQEERKIGSLIPGFVMLKGTFLNAKVALMCLSMFSWERKSCV